MNEDEILAKLREILREAFEIEPSRVIPSAKLYDELGLDSIDAVDLAIKLQEMTGKRIKPENFKGVRTVGDVIGVVQSLLAA
ncbi:MAG: acyl carrier protein [Betaproteobacteria bacterium]|nr:acyl carrier protein [Betaproteobacteria bacterium]